MYVYTHEQSQNSPTTTTTTTTTKYNRLTWRRKEIKNYLYQLRIKLSQAQAGNQK